MSGSPASVQRSSVLFARLNIPSIKNSAPIRRHNCSRFFSFSFPQLFYDADILEENVLLDWANKPRKKYVSAEVSQEIHKAAEPFIKWLKEAEEEEESDDDSEDDVEVSEILIFHQPYLLLGADFLIFFFRVL